MRTRFTYKLSSETKTLLTDTLCSRTTELIVGAFVQENFVTSHLHCGLYIMFCIRTECTCIVYFLCVQFILVKYATALLHTDFVQALQKEQFAVNARKRQEVPLQVNDKWSILSNLQAAVKTKNRPGLFSHISCENIDERFFNIWSDNTTIVRSIHQNHF